MTTLPEHNKRLIAGIHRLQHLKLEASRADHNLTLSGNARSEAAALRKALPHWHPENIYSAMVYPTNGGWNADILLHDAPADEPLLLDRGEGQPFATFQEAERFLARFLTALTAAWAPQQFLSLPAADPYATTAPMCQTDVPEPASTW